MGTFKSIVEIIRIFLWAIKFFKGEIDEVIFKGHLKKIRKAIKRAKKGSLEERLKGGQDVEDNFNRRAPK